MGLVVRRGVKQRLATEFLISAKPKPRFRVQVNKAIRSLLRRTTVRDSRCCPLGVAVVVPRRRRGVSRVRSRRRGAEVRHSRRVNRDARGIDTRTRRARGRRGLPARTDAPSAGTPGSSGSSGPTGSAGTALWRAASPALLLLTRATGSAHMTWGYQHTGSDRGLDVAQRGAIGSGAAKTPRKVWHKSPKFQT